MHLTVKSIYNKKKKHQKITVLTAYDFPTARILDEAGIDIILVGDSLGMVVLGYKDTLSVKLDDMVRHTEAVARAAKNSLIVADLPYKSYQTASQALLSGRKLIAAGAHAVKLEGGREVLKQIKVLIKNKIPVMGHLGMLPQSVKKLGGYKVQGRDPAGAQRLLDEAQLLDRSGVFSMVLECVPATLAEKITRKVKCPAIGIGAGVKTDGQVLVLHDMLGFKSHVQPRFVRHYGNIESAIGAAVRHYREDVVKGKFPSQKESY